ncbi:ciliogenesis and planar polarity effector 2-like [Amphiura filiformis]|uniref:ciliogenesis and planar polarity effector 2-like n=1 Tax=Amphiura filiformis TaxID=82378 RepID=UPI003B2105B3
MEYHSSHIQYEWYKTTEGRQYYSAIVRQGKRKIYGLLERPVFSLQVAMETASYKLFITGKAGVGKSSTVAKLTGQSVPTTHNETPGIVTSVAYWPAKLKESGKIVLFKLQFWDAGENAIKKFDHILPACQDGASAVLFLFSFTDRPSFEDLRNQMTKLSETGASFTKIVIGTKYDQYSHSEITSAELQDFQDQWQVPILKVKNINKPQENDLLYSVDNFAEINDVAPLLNGLVESLWTKGKVPSGTWRESGGGPTGRPPGPSRTPAPSVDDLDDATYV